MKRTFMHLIVALGQVFIAFTIFPMACILLFILGLMCVYVEKSMTLKENFKTSFIDVYKGFPEDVIVCHRRIEEMFNK